MKKCAALIGLIGFVLTARSLAAQTTVNAVVDRTQYLVGDTVRVQVVLAGNPGIHGLFFDLVYDSSVLTFEELKEGSLASAETRGKDLVWAVSNQQTAARLGSRVVVSYSLRGTGSAFATNGVIAEAVFRVTGAGASGVNQTVQFAETGMVDALGQAIASVQWQQSSSFRINPQQTSAYIVLSSPYQNQMFYEPTALVNAVYTAGEGNTVILTNQDGTYTSAPIPGSSGVLTAANVPLTYGYNRLSAQLLNAQGLILARDAVTVFRSAEDKYLRFLSPLDHELVGTDLISVAVSSPYDVEVNGLKAEFYGDMDGLNRIYKTRIWLRQGFNTLTAVATNPEGAKYSKSVQVYYRKDSSIFEFVTPLTGQYFKPEPGTKLRVSGEIDSPYKTAVSALGGAPVVNTVTLRAIFTPSNRALPARTLVNDLALTIEESEGDWGSHSAYRFKHDFDIPLDGLSQGEIELIAYKNKNALGADAEIHRIVYVDDSRLWINLVQPSVMVADNLDSRERFITFGEGQPPETLDTAVTVEGAIALTAGQPATQREKYLKNGQPQELSNVVDLAETEDGTIYALTSRSETIKIYRRTLGQTVWEELVSWSGMFGYRLAATSQGLLVGASNLSAPEDSGLYILKDRSLVNLRFPVALKHVQFIEHRAGKVYLYGNYFSAVYCFDVNQMVESDDFMTIPQLSSLSLDNNLILSQFVLSPDAGTVALRALDGQVSFYQRVGSGFASVPLPAGSAYKASLVIPGFYEVGDYNAYVLMKEDGAEVLMENRTKAGTFYRTDVNLAAWLKPAPGDWKVLGGNFRDDAFTFLVQDVEGIKTRRGQVFFSQFTDRRYPTFNALVFPTSPAPTSGTVSSLFISEDDLIFTGWGLSASGTGSGANLVSYFRRYDVNSEGKFAFNYVNEDIEGLTGFEFEVDPVWLEHPDYLKFSFALLQKGVGPADPAHDGILFSSGAGLTLPELLASSDPKYKVTRSWDSDASRELIHVEFNDLQRYAYLRSTMNLKSPGYSSPALYAYKVFKKIYPQVTTPHRGVRVTVPIHGFIYDKTVSEVTVAGTKIALARDGSFHHDLSVDTSLERLPVEIYCYNVAGDQARLAFTLEIVESRNGIGGVNYAEGAEVFDLGLELERNQETLTLSGSMFGLVGAVAGYELYSFTSLQGMETPKLVSQGLLTKTKAADQAALYAELGIPDPGAGYEASRFQGTIDLIPGRQQLRVFAQNPGGLRADYKPEGQFPVVTYSLGEGDQHIEFYLDAAESKSIAGVPMPVSGSMRLQATETGTPPAGPFVFSGSGELAGAVKSLHRLDDLIVKSFTPGLVFSNGTNEIRIPVEAGNRFQVGFTYTMGTAPVKNFYIGVIPTIPAMTSLARAVEITVEKSFKDTAFIPDFAALRQGNWTAEQQKTYRIPVTVSFNRTDLPLNYNVRTDLVRLSLSLNFGEVQSGVLRARDDGRYSLFDDSGKTLTLSGIKTGKNRLSWTLQYTSPLDENTVLMSSSTGGKTGMTDFLFDVAPNHQVLPTQVSFTPGLTTDTYYDASDLPKLNVVKDEGTELTITLNGVTEWAAGSARSLNGLTLTAPAEGRNEIGISYTEPFRGTIAKTYTFLYDSAVPAVGISSYRFAADHRTLSEITATVREANFRQGLLYFGTDIVNLAPELIPLDADTTLVVWRNLDSRNIVPRQDKQVGVRALDKAGKEAAAWFGGLSQETERPDENPVKEELLAMPSYSGTPALANEAFYQVRSFAMHTKFAPKEFLRWKSVKAIIAEQGNVLNKSLLSVEVPSVPTNPSYSSSVAVDGDWAATRSPTGDTVSVYHKDNNGDWVFHQELTASDYAAGDGFGLSLAISGDTLFAGSPSKGGGVVYVFERDTENNWIEAPTKLVASDGAAGDQFGNSIAISGASAVIGAMKKASGVGAAYVFVKNLGIWGQKQKIVAFGGDLYSYYGDWALSSTSKTVSSWLLITRTRVYYRYRYRLVPTTQLFGRSVAVSDDTVLIGSPYSDAVWVLNKYKRVIVDIINADDEVISKTSDVVTDMGVYSQTVVSDLGAVYSYKKDTGGNWIAQDRLWKGAGTKGTDFNTNFGSGVAVSGNVLVVGFPGNKVKGTGSGSAWVYERGSAGTWARKAVLVPADNQVGDNCGNSVAVVGNTILVGAPRDNNDNGVSAGAAYVYTRNSAGTWTEGRKYLPFTGAPGDQFGQVALSGGTAIVGGFGMDSALIYTLNGASASVGTLRFGEPEGYGKYLVFRFPRDPFVITGEEAITDKTQFEAVGLKQNVVTGAIDEVRAAPLVFAAGKAKYVTTGTHVFYVVEIQALKDLFTVSRATLFAGGPPSGYEVYDWGQLRIKYSPAPGGPPLPVKPDDIFVIGETADAVSAFGDLVFYDRGYETPNAEPNTNPVLDAALDLTIDAKTFVNPATVQAKTWSFWMRPEDEARGDPDYGVAVRRVFTFVDAGGAEVFKGEYRGQKLFFLTPDGVVNLIPGGLELDNGWHFVCLRLLDKAYQKELSLTFDGMALGPMSLVPYGDLAGKLVQEGASLYFGASEGVRMNTGFFSIADVRTIDKILTDDELLRKMALGDKNTGAGERMYRFPDGVTEAGSEPFALRKAALTLSVTPTENADYGEPSGKGSLLATAGKRNAFSILSLEGGGDYVRFTDAGSYILYKASLTAGPGAFTLKPTGASARFAFGDRRGNYGLKKADFYSLSGTVEYLEPGKTANLVLRINGREENYALAKGSFNFIYDNRGRAEPADVACFVSMTGEIRFGTDLALNEGNYRVAETLTASAVRTFFPFDVDGTVSLRYKPLNSNSDGFVNEEAVLLDGEYLKLGTSLDASGEAVYYAVIKADGTGAEAQRLVTGVKVRRGWQHLQISYSTKTNVLYFYIDGKLAAKSEGAGLPVFGSLLGLSPANPDGTFKDNVFLGCDAAGTTFAEGYLDEILLSRYYQGPEYTDNAPLRLSWNGTAKTLDWTATETDLPTPEAKTYAVSTLTGTEIKTGSSFPADLGSLAAGRYRVEAAASINGHRYEESVILEINDVPGFVLLDSTPIVFKGYSRDVRLSFAFDKSIERETPDQQYAGLGIRLTYTDAGGSAVSKVAWLVQDFMSQVPGEWIIGIEEAGDILWTDLASENTGRLPVIFSQVSASSDLSIRYKPFYFKVSESSVFNFDGLPNGAALPLTVPLASLSAQPYGPDHEYRLDVRVGREGQASNAVFSELVLDMSYASEDGLIKGTKSFKVGEDGRTSVFYDDLLPGYGTWLATVRLNYGGIIYADLPDLRLGWEALGQAGGVTDKQIKDLQIVDFTALQVDREDNTASFNLEYYQNEVSAIQAELEVIQDGRILTNYGQIPFNLYPTQNDNRELLFDVPIPKGLFTARITLTGAGFYRTREIEVNNDAARPEVVLTNSVDSLISYDTVYFSWKGFYQGRFNQEIEYSYNFDQSGWTTPNADWRSVRFYNLGEGYHEFAVKARYGGQESAVRNVTFFVDVKRPQFAADPAKIVIDKVYDEGGVFHAVNITGLAGAVTDASLDRISVAGVAATKQENGGFIVRGVPITLDGINTLGLTAYDRIGNFSDKKLTVENSLTEIYFPDRKARYMPLTVVGKLNDATVPDVAIYLADPTVLSKAAGDFAGWKKATVNEDRTLFLENVTVNPGTADREILTTLRMATVFHPESPNRRIFERKLDVWANQLFMPIEMKLSSHALAGEDIASQVTIECMANVENISSWSIDFDGDGVYDLIEPVDNPEDAAAKSRNWTHRYSSLGRVTPRVRVITTEGQFFSVTDSLIIHERIQEASNKPIEQPLGMSVVNKADGSRLIFVLRKAGTSHAVETYEIPADDAYLSNMLSYINLTALGVVNPVRILAIDQGHLAVAGNAAGSSTVYLLKANAYGNYQICSAINLFDEIKDLTGDIGRLYLSLAARNEIVTLPIKADYTFDASAFQSRSVAIEGARPLGMAAGLAKDGQGLLLADFFNHRILRLDADLKALEQYGTFGDGEGQFLKPSLVKTFENRIFVYDEARRDIQVFDSEFKPIARLGYELSLGGDNYLEQAFLNEVADLGIITKEEGDNLYYYALILSKTENKLALLRLPQWEELRARVRNNKIVFLKDREIFTAKPDGSDLSKLLTSDSLPPVEGLLNYPALSPDGRHLVFVSKLPLFKAVGSAPEVNGATGYTYLYRSDIEAKTLTYLPLRGLQGYRIERPVFSSNGDKIIFSARPEGGKWQIYVYECATQATTKLFASEENARFPYYSPDDRFVVFTTDYDGDEEIEIIDTVNPTMRITVTANHARDSFPVWSAVYPFEVANQDLKVESKIAFVSERDYQKAVYAVYLARRSEGDLRVFDLKRKEDVGINPDKAALKLTLSGIEGDYPSFTGDGRRVLFEYFDGSLQRLKSFSFEENLNVLLTGTGSVALTDVDLITGATRPAGMKNMITGFTARNTNGNDVVFGWSRYTDQDIFYHVYFKKNKEGEAFADKKYSSQDGALLTGLDMGQEYLARVLITENGEEVATSQWKKILIPEVAAKPTVTVDASNPYLVRLHAWKPLPETKWKFSWIIDNQEIPVQASQDFLYEYGTSGAKTILLKAATLGDTATHVSEPVPVAIRSDIEPVIEYRLADDGSYIELSAMNSKGNKIDFAGTTWTISGPGRDQIQQTGPQPIVQLNGFQRKINVSLALRRIAVNGQNATDTLQKTITIDLDFSEVRPVIVYATDLTDRRLVKFSGEYSKGNIDWYRSSWTVFADNGVIATKEGASTFSYRFPETGTAKTYSVSLTLPRRNDGMTETANQVVTIEATPMEPVIDYRILDLKQGSAVVGQKLVLDATQSRGSEIDFTQARWTLPIAGTYGEGATQIGPTAAYNLVGIAADTILEVSLTLTRRGGTDARTVSRIIKIAAGELAETKLAVNQTLETSKTGKIVTLDVLKSTGPNIEWEKTEWIIEGASFRGPVAQYPISASSEKPVVRYSVVLHRSGGTPLTERGEVRGLIQATIEPMICVDSVHEMNGDTVLELSVRRTSGVNIDWERTLWTIYDGAETVTQKRGVSIVHAFKPLSERMGYPVLVEMYLKDGSKPFVGYKSVDIAEDVFSPVITSEASAGDANTLTLSAVESRGSGILWGNAKWSFGDSSETQYGQSVSHTFPADTRDRTYIVSLTLSRGNGATAETRTVTKKITIGKDAIKPVITARRMGDTLVLSAEDSLGTGLLLDRSTWLFTGESDSVNEMESKQVGVVRKDSYAVNAKAGTAFKLFGLTIFTEAGVTYLSETTDYDDYQNNNTTYSSQNQHIGAVCRRYIKGKSIVQVTLMVYRATKDGKIEGESIKVNVDVKKAQSEVKYGN